MRLINASLVFAIVAAAAAPVLVSAQRGVTATPAGPIEVLIIRHGEEPQSGPDLNDQGRARAKALIGYFKDPFSLPTSLFAAKPSKQSARAVETLTPLSKALNLPIDARFTALQFKELATTVLHGSRHDGGHIVICWLHDTIPQLAAALGVANPPKWPSAQYDHVWRIRYGKNKQVTLTDEPQGLTLSAIK